MEYTWKITPHDLEVNNNDEIIAVNWKLECKSGNATWLSSGKVNLNAVDPLAFITIDDVSKENVILWVEEAMGAEELQFYKDQLEIFCNKSIKNKNEGGAMVSRYEKQRPQLQW